MHKPIRLYNFAFNFISVLTSAIRVSIFFSTFVVPFSCLFIFLFNFGDGIMCQSIIDSECIVLKIVCVLMLLFVVSKTRKNTRMYHISIFLWFTSYSHHLHFFFFSFFSFTFSSLSFLSFFSLTFNLLYVFPLVFAFVIWYTEL